MRKYVLTIQEVDRSMADRVGGKGANLGELARIDGVQVPDGFCIPHDAFEHAWPEDLAADVARHLARLGVGCPVAVRSSAVGEDGLGSSFAGQHESYLAIVGVEAVVDHIHRCRASLEAGRAVAYRRRNGIADREVRMAVVVQRMVAPQAAGVMFTADPLNGDRKVVAIEAVAGLGDALVAGHVAPQRYRVRDGAVVAAPDATPLLDGSQVLALAALGRTIEAHFGEPQDVEWCLADGTFHVVQARPITTLFPIPEPREPGNRVYLSVGHQQMMTDAMKPLGLSFFQLVAGRPMMQAGGRLFVDITAQLATPAGRAMMLAAMGQHDPLLHDALRGLLERGDFLEALPAGPTPAPPPPAPPAVDPAIVAELIAANEASVAELAARLEPLAGTAVLEAIADDVPRLKALLHDPRGTAVFMPAMQAATWLNEHVEAWLGEKGVADVLSQAVPNNVTSAMGLALMDVADVLRPHPEVIAYLRRAAGPGFLEGLDGVDGGPAARAAIAAFLDRYGARAAGEIDLTRPRWAEDPAALVPALLGNVRAFEPGAARRKFEQGRNEAEAKAREVLERLARLPDGAAKAEEARRWIDVLRAYIGYREYPKFGMIRRYALYRRALWREAGRLARAGVLRDADDVAYLTFEELRAVAASGQADQALIDRRKADHARFARLTPPRVITSDGEIPAGRYRRADLPAGSLVGLAVSAGVVEGRARVVARMEDAELEEGDILVTTFTDPSWTPLFVAIKGLVTEVGGLMTHGAVIAREYGLPAVVGVEGATTRIADGQRIRVHGTEGYVELLG